MAERGRYYWLKLKEDFFDDKVIKYLRKLPEGPTLVIIYLKMQLKSLKTEGFLRYDGILPTCEEELALVLDENPLLVSGAINALVKMGVVERWDNDTLYMKAMQELIGSETASAHRMRKHRELKMAQGSGASSSHCDALPSQCDTSVTQRYADVTECYTEIERRDRDREKREETEIEIEGELPPPSSPSSPDPAGEVVLDYLDRINPEASATSLAKLRGFANAMGAAVCKRAFDIALDEKKTTWSYIQAILQNKQAQGVKCLADWDAMEEKKGGRHGAANGRAEEFAGLKSETDGLF